MVAIFAILFVYIVYRIFRGLVTGRTWPWIIALVILLIMIAAVL